MSTAVNTRLSGPARRAQILEAARSEFVARGLAGARVQEIADVAGVTDALIYKHFKSKKELFQEAIIAPLEERIASHAASMRALPEDPQGAAQGAGTREWILELLRFFRETIEGLGVVLFGEQQGGRDLYNRHLRPIMDAYIQAGEENLPRWPHREYDVDSAVQLAFGVAFWLSLDQSMRKTDEDLEARADLIADLILNGVRARDVER